MVEIRTSFQETGFSDFTGERKDKALAKELGILSVGTGAMSLEDHDGKALYNELGKRIVLSVLLISAYFIVGTPE